MSDKIKTLDKFIDYVNKNDIKMFYGEPLADYWHGNDNIDEQLLTALCAVGWLKYLPNDNSWHKLDMGVLDADSTKKCLCQLLKLFVNRGFNACIDIKLLLEQNNFFVTKYQTHPGLVSAKGLFISKDDCNICIPYWTTKHLIQKNRVFKFICKVIDGLYFENKCYPYEYDNTPVYCGKLKKAWGDSFDSFYSKIKEWYRVNGR